ncbi:Hint domain-containing protein [Chitinophaga rhizophila]|uniref:Hint domain-containing protein n=1 Tax=Chitinophaga rhizophila TaxID=2866212 RepID=A0ABS7GL94_9BACT|nr:hypothetical protein [Chitinophaga rhizophila]MBW8688206.1 hypothetical protein [Chitinophaga rhizophila]
MKKYLLTLLFTVAIVHLMAQSRPMTMAEYTKAKTFTVKDLDNDTYVKFNNEYVLDRYEMRKPYLITGDDGQKKRIDLYRLVAKDSMQDIATVIFYTNEAGKLYTAVMPLFNSNADIWNQYFEDIHAIDKVEKNYVLKLSYVLSKEFSYQLYKSMHAGKDVKEEAGTYGTDICFPGDQLVNLANGKQKALRDIRPGDEIISPDMATQQTHTIRVKELVQHTAENYAITRLLIIHAKEQQRGGMHEVILSGKLLQATPNHPVLTVAGRKQMGAVSEGDQLLCMDAHTRALVQYTVVNKTESAGGKQPVYNIVAEGGDAFMMNNIMVLQK